MAKEQDLIVIRASPNLPDGWLSPILEGLWVDRSKIRLHSNVPGATMHYAEAVPTGQFEERDGIFAEVYEVRPRKQVPPEPPTPV